MMEPTKKRRGSLLRNMFASSSSSNPSTSPNKKARAEIGLTNTTLRLVSSPEEPKPAFTVFQTRMLKVADGKGKNSNVENVLHYGPVEAPKAPVPVIRVIKPDGFPFVLKEEYVYEDVRGGVEPMMGVEGSGYRGDEEVEERYSTGSEFSIVPTPLPTPPESPVEVSEESIVQGGIVRSRSRASSLSRIPTIQSRKNSFSRIQEGRIRSSSLHRLDTSQNNEAKPLKHVRFDLPMSDVSSMVASHSPSPPSPPLTPPNTVLPLFARLPVSRPIERPTCDNTTTKVQMVRRKAVPTSEPTIIPTVQSHYDDEKIPVEVTVPPGSIIGGDIHPYFRRYDKELPLPPAPPMSEDPSLTEDGSNDNDDISSVSSLDSFSSMSSFSSAGLSYPLSDEDNEDSIVGTRDSMSTMRDSWMTLYEKEDELVRKKEAEANEARMRRMKEMAVELKGKGPGAGTLKWGGMGIKNNSVVVRKPVGGVY